MSEENKDQSQDAKNKKINKMSLAEVESAIKKSADKMNGEKSKYVQHLFERKKELTK